MGIGRWINRKLAILSLAMGRVEKNAFSQSGEVLTNNMSQEQRHTQGTVADDLKQGKITAEVENLRWRMYKVLEETQGRTAEIVGYDDDGMPIVQTKKIDHKASLRKIKLEPSDKYGLEMVVDNSEIVMSGNEAMDNDHIQILESVSFNYDDDGNILSGSHGVISGEEYFATNKTEKPIFIERDSLPKFEIETYTKKLYIRKMNGSKRLLEFFVSMYPDEYNRTSRLFLSDVKKAIINPSESTILNFNGVGFITYNTVGSGDFLEYKYGNVVFDKIVVYNGHYVIKFIADVETDGVSILEGHRVVSLDKKYETKEKK
jgi:hypothetical protein